VIENALATVEKTRRITALASTLANVAKFCRACGRLTTPSPGRGGKEQTAAAGHGRCDLLAIPTATRFQVAQSTAFQIGKHEMQISITQL